VIGFYLERWKSLPYELNYV